MFNNLIASRPARERRWSAWLIAGALHLLVLSLVPSLITQRSSETLEIFPDAIVLPEEPVSLPDRESEPALQPAAPAQGTNSEPAARMESERAAPVTTRGAGEAVQQVTPSTGRAAETAAISIIGSRIRPLDIVTTPTPTAAEGARARVAERLQPFKDSILAEQTAATRAKDWTTGEGAKRWGLSPGTIHLGNKTIPATRATGTAPPPDVIVPPPGRRDETNTRLRTWRDIEVQANRAEARETFELRVQQIRERNQRKHNPPT